jgi:hypothetical protein
MSARQTVPGFCYVAGIAVTMTAAEWRAKYPPTQYRRRVEAGETFYSRKWDGTGPGPVLAAEAYAIIPAGK